MKVVTLGASLKIFPLSFAEVSVALGAMHLIEVGRLSALRSRIKDFQRREFPPGLNTGKGRAADYGPEHVTLLAVAFEFLELGMTPERICNLLRSTGAEILREVRNICGGRAELKKSRTFVYFDPRGLSELRDGKDFAGGQPGIFIGTAADLSLRLKSPKANAPRLAVIDIGQLVLLIIIGVSGAKERPHSDTIDDLEIWGTAK